MVIVSIVLIDDMNPFVHAVESEIYDYHSTRIIILVNRIFWYNLIIFINTQFCDHIYSTMEYKYPMIIYIHSIMTSLVEMMTYDVNRDNLESEFGFDRDDIITSCRI